MQTPNLVQIAKTPNIYRIRIHSTDADLKGDTSLSYVPKTQHGDTNSSNSQMKSQDIDAELQFLQYLCHPSQDENIIQKTNLITDTKMAYSDIDSNIAYVFMRVW